MKKTRSAEIEHRDLSIPDQMPPAEPSPWVRRFAPLIRARGSVLDYACGAGRHARLLAAQDLQVVAADRDATALQTLSGVAGIEVVEADLERGPWVFVGRRFDAIIVTNYLFRPRLEMLLDRLAPDGMLIYETFMVGNERFGRPRNPDFLLAPGELLDRLRDRFTIVAFEQGEVARPRPAMIQRVCAWRGTNAPGRLPTPWEPVGSTGQDALGKDFDAGR